VQNQIRKQLSHLSLNPKKNKGAHTASALEAAPPRRGKQIILNPKPHDINDDINMTDVIKSNVPSGGSATKKQRPNLLDAVQGSEPWREGAAKILNRLNRHEWIRRDSEWGTRIRWHQAVAHVFPALREAYLAKIKNPTDLGLVEDSLRQGEYESPDHFVTELIRVFDNAIKYNADAKKNTASIAPDDYAPKIYDIASHLRDWCQHLALEFLIEPRNPAKRGENFVCSLDTAELGAAREKDALRREQEKQQANDADLDASALASFVSKSAIKETGSVIAKETGSAITNLTEEKRLDARRLRDEIVWPSRLQYNHKANVQAKKVIKALRQQSFKKYSQAFEDMVSTTLVPDYTQFVAEPTSIKRVEQRLALSLSAENLTPEATNLLPEYYQLEPYETLGEMAMELRRVFTNALKYNARFRADPNSRGAQICQAVDLLSPILEDALFNLAFEAYDRVRTDRILGDWNRQIAEQARIETQRLEKERAEMRQIAKVRFQEMQQKPKLANRIDRLRIFRGLSLLGVESLDIMAPDELAIRQKNIKLLTAPKPALLRRESSVSISGYDDLNAKNRDESQLPPVTEEIQAPSELCMKSYAPFRLLVRSQCKRAPSKAPIFSSVTEDKNPFDNDQQMKDAHIPSPSRTPIENNHCQQEKEKIPTPDILHVVEATDGDTNWIELDQNIQARVLISTYDDCDHDMIRCSVVLRAHSSPSVDFSLVNFECISTAHKQLQDAFFAAAAAKRHRQHINYRSQLILDLVELPFSLHPTFTGLAMTPPLPSRREGLPYLEQIFIAPSGTLSISLKGIFAISHPVLSSVSPYIDVN